MKQGGAGSNKLNKVQKEFVLRCLALGFSLTDTAAFVADEFDIEIRRQSVHYYAQKYPAKIAELHDELAADMLKIPLASKVVRVATLDRLARRAMQKDEFAEARATMKQIAEEVGDIVERKEVTVRGHEAALEELV